MAKFEVQARVVDLLGTQQIANCPTAISELFKNAYDAYARSVMLDVDPEDGHAILWDDGVGMTEEELLHRWLVVGAAGKEKLRSSLEPPEGMSRRPIQGEKGIGRLAISTLGDTLLLVSRSRRPPAGADPFVALLINWNLVRNERLLLSDIEIPTITFSDLEELETGIVADMVESLRGVVRETEAAWDEEGNEALREKILRQLDSFRVDISVLHRLATGRSGTLFLIRDLIEDFHSYIERPGRDENLERHPNVELVQLLSNFHKTFEQELGIPDDNEQDFRADVRRLDSSTRQWRSFFEENEAIGPEDLRAYDHYIDVEFDKDGRYHGTFEIYGDSIDLRAREFQPKGALSCGPFRLRLWYFQGRQDESRLGAEDFELIGKKLKLFGGLMIYRDNLRVLPYGNPEFDWLRFEERRSKAFSRYFFSYRRMFGYVDTSRRNNPRLVDKAGREGLIQNAEYRDLREILIEFFSDLALRYFHKGGESFGRKKAELKEKTEHLKAERKRVQQQRNELRSEAQEKLDLIAKNGPDQLELFLDQGLGELRALDEPGPPDVAAAIVRFEDRLGHLEGRARLRVPTGLSLGRDRELQRLVHDHGVAAEAFSAACHEIRQKFTEVVRQSWPEAEHAVDRQRILDNAHKQTLARLGRTYQTSSKQLEDEQAKLTLLFEESYQQQRALVDSALMSATSTSSIDDARRSEVEDLGEVVAALNHTADEAVVLLETQGERLGTYLRSYLEGEPDKLRKYQFEEIEELREQVDRNLELVQLGLSVEIIDHDLERLYRGIRANISRLRNMVRNAPNASRLTAELGASFQHLEQRYKLMSPLYRGSYRLKDRIDGVRILTYCRSFLDGPLRSVGATLEASEEFRAYAIREVPAVVLPVFVNLIDNSIYWLRDQPERRIFLDRCGEVLTVCDTGPGIHPTLFEEIFEPFVSTKPSGRGLGLYIARANLTRYHHAIWATDDPVYRKLPGACLCIRFHEDVVLSEE